MKLSDINQGAVQPLQSKSPQSALIKSQAKLNVANDIYKLGEAVGQVKSTHDVITANADYRSAVNSYEKEVSDMAYATPDQLREWGIADQVDMQDANGNDMQAIPKWKWYSVGLERVMEKNLESAGGRIMSPKARLEWEARAREASDNELEAAYARSGQMAIEASQEEATREYKRALDTGDFEKAREMLNSPLFSMNPSLQKTMRTEIDKAEELSNINRQLATEDVGQLNDLISEITSPDYDSTLNNEEYLRMFATVTSRRDSLQAKQEAQLQKYQDNLAIDGLVGISSGELGIAWVNANAKALGKENHARLITAARTAATSGVISSPILAASYTRRILELESGISTTGEVFDFEAEVQKLQRQLIDDTMSFNEEGDPVMNLSNTDAVNIGRRLKDLKPFPFMTEEYKYTVGDLTDVILGRSDIEKMVASESSKAMLSRATASLRNYIEANGGTQADIAKWRTNEMPRFMGEVAKTSALNLPEAASSFLKYSKSGEFKVDRQATLDEFNRKMAAATNPAQITRLQEAAVAYDEWLNRFGDDYAY